MNVFSPEALSTVHESYKPKIGKVKEDLHSQLQLKYETIEAAKIEIPDNEVPGHTTNVLSLWEVFLFQFDYGFTYHLYL